MHIDPNLVLQLLITIGNLIYQIQQGGEDLDGKTQEEVKQVLIRLNDSMKNQPDV